MSRSVILHCPATLLILTLAAGTTLRAAAADDSDPAPPPGRPSREELREQLKGLTPAERQAKIRELREKAGGGAPLGEEAQKRMPEFRKFRESIRDLPPPERELKIREYREKNMIPPLRPSAMSPEDRQGFRTKFSERIQEHLDALQKKKAAGSLTEMESRRLQNMQQMAARLKTRGEKSGKDDATGNLGLPPPRPSTKPAPPADNKQ